MERITQRMMEKELQRALAIEYVINNYKQNKISLDKLKSQQFVLSYNECAFAQTSNIKPQGLINDKETMPKVTLIIRLEEGKLKLEETEYTKEFLYIN